MTRAQMLLALAITLEVIGTLSLRLADGFSRPGWTVVTIAGYGLSIAVFARALQDGMGLGVGYATLVGVGLFAAAAASAVVFDEGLGLIEVSGLGLLLFGVILLQRPAPEGDR